jgi:fructose-1,6-bisphosphatase I
MENTHVVTIDRHILELERRYPDATGAFSNILYDLALAAKIISREVTKAGLVDILGAAGETNVQGEEVQKLDEYAQEVIYKAMDHTGHLCCMVSEEREDIIHIPEKFPAGDYVLVFDPLDGSSNIDVNVSVGTIFSLLKKVSSAERGSLEDCLQPGLAQVAAGYVVYGSSTMMVYTVGAGVHGFTLDPSIGEFLLSHPDIKIPDPGLKQYSVNEANYGRWSEGQKRLMQALKSPESGFSSRYIGSLVADFHRVLLRGGIFMYPGDHKNPSGKLRLLYEASPMAFLCEQAGGKASDGQTRIMELQPDGLHQRTPLYLGATPLVEQAEDFLASNGEN